MSGAQYNPYGDFKAWKQIRAIPSNELSPGAKLAYNALVSRNKNGTCFPSMKRLGEDLGVTRSQAQRYVVELERFGLIVRRPHFRDGRQTSNEFEFRHPTAASHPKTDDADLHTQSAADRRPTRASDLPTSPYADLHSQEGVQEEVQRGRRSEGSADGARGASATRAGEWFATQFWPAYPTKIGRGKCELWAVRNAKSPDVQAAIMAGLNRQLRQGLAECGRFIPNPLTWLTEKRWTDESPPRGLPEWATDQNVFMKVLAQKMELR